VISGRWLTSADHRIEAAIAHEPDKLVGETAFTLGRKATIVPAHKMARTTSPQNSLRLLVDEFVGRLMTAIEADASARARQMVIAALEGGTLPRRRGRPPKFPKFTPMLSAGPVRRRAKQLCPVSAKTTKMWPRAQSRSTAKPAARKSPRPEIQSRRAARVRRPC
jgi:hypothetical protein